jgi:C1A family cysteine protease
LLSLLATLLAAGLGALPARARTPEPAKAPVSPRFAAWVAYHMPRGAPGPVGGGKEGALRTRGYIPSPVDLSHVHGPVFSAGVGKPPFPPVYDLRLQGLLTPVKDQGIWGTCWTFACLGSLEFSMLRGGYGTCDLSEWHLAYYGYVPYNQSLMVAFTPGPPSFGADPIFDQGGSDWMSAAILGRGTGAVSNQACPYQPWSYQNKPIPEGDLPNGTEEVEVPLKGAYYLFNEEDPTSYDDVKYALMHYGPVVVVMDWEDDDFDETYNTFRNATASLYTLNHEVCIVGWDDTFPADRFPKGNRPDAPGAWMVRNSWGTAWGDQGYFYLSYDSKMFDGTTFEGEPRVTRRIRQYDPLGWCNSIGYNGPTAWCANVFRADQAETATAVAFYTGAVNTEYRLEFRTGVHGDPGTGVPLGPPQSGIFLAPGFHVVPLDCPVTLPGGDYAAVLKLTTPGYDYPVPVQQPYAGYSESSEAHHGRSYTSADGQAWQDLAPTCAGSAVCLKVLVQ